MNKGQLIDAVASELGASKVAAGKAIDAVIASITQGVNRDDSVTIAGFGTFAKKNRPPARRAQSLHRRTSGDQSLPHRQLQGEPVTQGHPLVGRVHRTHHIPVSFLFRVLTGYPPSSENAATTSCCAPCGRSVLRMRLDLPHRKRLDGQRLINAGQVRR